MRDKLLTLLGYAVRVYIAAALLVALGASLVIVLPIAAVLTIGAYVWGLVRRRGISQWIDRIELEMHRADVRR